MKSFMQLLLAAFGIMSLVLAGCASTDTVVEDDDEDTVVEEEEVVEEVEETVEDAE